MGESVVRPRKCRKVRGKPDVTYFKPRGVPMSSLKDVSMPVEGFEALRLADHNGLSQEAAAVAMEVSRQTFGRILFNARQCVAKVLVNGFALRIQGGAYAIADEMQNEVPEPKFQSVPSPETISPTYNKKESVMVAKLAISSEGPRFDDMLDPRFGRAAGFIFVDPQTLEFEYVDNGASQSMAQGAGIQATETVANRGAKIVLTGYVGPKALQALTAADIKVGQNLENMTVRQAIEAYNSDNVDWAQQSNRQEHGQ